MARPTPRIADQAFDIPPLPSPPSAEHVLLPGASGEHLSDAEMDAYTAQKLSLKQAIAATSHLTTCLNCIERMSARYQQLLSADSDIEVPAEPLPVIDLSPAKFDQMVAMLDDGISEMRISLALGISRRVINKYRAGLLAPPPRPLLAPPQRQLTPAPATSSAPAVSPAGSPRCRLIREGGRLVVMTPAGFPVECDHDADAYRLIQQLAERADGNDTIASKTSSGH